MQTIDFTRKVRFLVTMSLLTMTMVMSAQNANKRILNQVDSLMNAGLADQALAIVEPLAEDGDSLAQLKTAFLYLTDDELRDPVKAEYWLEKTGVIKEPEIQYALGAIYLIVNNDKALHFLRLSAEQGYTEAEFLCGLVLLDKSDSFEGMKLIERAADNGNPRASFHLGNMYYTGAGVAKDEKKAEKLWQNAFAKGYSSALTHVFKSGDRTWKYCITDTMPYTFKVEADSNKNENYMMDRKTERVIKLLSGQLPYASNKLSGVWKQSDSKFDCYKWYADRYRVDIYVVRDPEGKMVELYGSLLDVMTADDKTVFEGGNQCHLSFFSDDNYTLQYQTNTGWLTQRWARSNMPDDLVDIFKAFGDNAPKAENVDYAQLYESVRKLDTSSQPYFERMRDLANECPDMKIAMQAYNMLAAHLPVENPFKEYCVNKNLDLLNNVDIKKDTAGCCPLMQYWNLQAVLRDMGRNDDYYKSTKKVIDNLKLLEREITMRENNSDLLSLITMTSYFQHVLACYTQQNYKETIKTGRNAIRYFNHNYVHFTDEQKTIIKIEYYFMAAYIAESYIALKESKKAKSLLDDVWPQLVKDTESDTSLQFMLVTLASRGVLEAYRKVTDANTMIQYNKLIRDKAEDLVGKDLGSSVNSNGLTAYIDIVSNTIGELYLELGQKVNAKLEWDRIMANNPNYYDSLTPEDSPMLKAFGGVNQ